MSITEKVEQFLLQYDLLKKDNTIIVAFSGGYDSLCLLNIIKELSRKYDIKPAAIHLNHNWRGDESKQDELNCKEFCVNNGIDFYCETLPSEIPKNETAAREARYIFFEKYAEKLTSKCILTAHNANDNAETVIYRIIKGTGTTGLEGIKAKRGIYYRPLINIYRDEIEQYCSDNKLKPNIDSSNNDIKYKRNLIRHKLLPVMKEINPCVIKAINSLSEIAVFENEIQSEYIENFLKNNNNRINTKDFMQSSKAIKFKIIYNLFTFNNLDYSKEKIENTVNFITENSLSKSGKTFSVTNNLWLFVNDNYITLIRNSYNSNIEIQVTTEGEYTIGSYKFSIKKCNASPDVFPKDNENKAFVNLENIEFNFTLRNRHDGDIINPYGLKGTQKLKKYLNNKKIPNYVKNELLLLCNDKEVLWVPHYGISEKIKVVNKPSHVLELKCIRGDDED